MVRDTDNPQSVAKADVAVGCMRGVGVGGGKLRHKIKPEKDDITLAISV